MTTNDTFHLLAPGVKPLTVSILPAQLDLDAGHLMLCDAMNGGEDVLSMKSNESCVHSPVKNAHTTHIVRRDEWRRGHLTHEEQWELCSQPCRKCKYTVGLASQLLQLCTEKPPICQCRHGLND